MSDIVSFPGKSRKRLERLGWASIIAYHEGLLWLEDPAGRDTAPEETAAEADAGYPGEAVLDQTPEIGRDYRLFVEKPFAERVGGVFWTLHQPAMSALNGWEESPQEIACSALVRCEFRRVIRRSERGARIAVSALEVVPLPRMPDLLPPASRGSAFEDFQPLGGRGCVRYEAGPFLLYDFHGEDVGASWLCLRRGDRLHLLTYEPWLDGPDFVFAGNRPLGESERRAFEALFPPYSHPQGEGAG